jgi:hypothetical protein
MKNIFPKSIGDLRTLGTPREWLKDAAGIAVLGALFLLIYILL